MSTAPDMAAVDLMVLLLEMPTDTALARFGDKWFFIEHSSYGEYRIPDTDYDTPEAALLAAKATGWELSE